MYESIADGKEKLLARKTTGKIDEVAMLKAKLLL